MISYRGKEIKQDENSNDKETALEALKKYNKEPFPTSFTPLTVEGVMRWFAQDQGYGEEEDFWGIAGLLHDIDLEMVSGAALRQGAGASEEAGAEDELIHVPCAAMDMVLSRM
ncbi:MAG: hypothetical protein ACLR0U_19490 [Enterocloster clostridioformis]